MSLPLTSSVWWFSSVAVLLWSFPFSTWLIQGVSVCVLSKKSLSSYLVKSPTLRWLALRLCSALWSSIFELFELAWAMPRHIRSLFTCWRGKCCSPQSEAIWKMIPLCMMWCIWKEINDRSLEDSGGVEGLLILYYFPMNDRLWLFSYF